MSRSLVGRLLLSFLAATVPARAAATYVYPLKVSSNGRFLVDQNDLPWRVNADSAWLMSVNATPTQVDTYLATRKAQGFNSFYLKVIVHPGGYGAAPGAPNNYNGDPPFATPNVFSTAGASVASERYWAWIDSIVDKAATSGMVVMFSYTYLGYLGGPQGWYQVVLSQPSRQACTDWGLWLGNRYKTKSNILWFALGDYVPPAGSEGEARTLAIINGIKASGATQLFMAEPSAVQPVPTIDAPAFASALDMNSFYGYGPTGRGEDYIDADRAWKVSPAKPAWVEEGGYEYEDNTGGFTGQPYETRRTRYWAVLGGGTAGDGFGSRDVYQWLNMPASLNTPGATYSTYAFQLFASLPWWDLRPSGTAAGYAGKDLITAGGGTRGQTDYVTSALTADGQYLLAYIPTTGGTGARTITVDMTALVGGSRGRWFNPATGAYTDIGTGLPNTGTRSFTSPGNNGSGTNDWLLVLDVPADLAVAKTGPASVTAGQNLAYTITATNNGPNDAMAVSVSDPTPSGLTLVSNTGACTTAFPCALGTLNVGQSQTFTSTFLVSSGYAEASSIQNTATVSSSTADLTPEGNTSTALTWVGTPLADLSIKVGPANLHRGGPAAYSITVTNEGPSDATEVQVADATPPGLTFVSNAGDCATAFPCALGTVTAGASRTITSTFFVPSGYTGPEPVVNSASVSSSTSDPDSSNNTASASGGLDPVSFSTLSPCRVVDTRDPAGPLGGPALDAGATRTFAIAGACGVPSTARAVAVNITVTQPTQPGDLRLYPVGSTPSLASAINYGLAQTRANNAVVSLGAGGAIDVLCDQASGTVHFILDVVGDFEPEPPR